MSGSTSQRFDLGCVCVRFSFIFSIYAALFAVCVLGQQGTTSLRGTILDKSGASIAGATVTLTNAERAVQRSATSSDTGAYEFVAIPPGTYSLRVEASGFRPNDQKDLQLLVNNPTTLNVTMLVGSSTETVEVSAQSETINTTDASLGVAFGENQVKQLPLESRNVGDLLSLQAGVVYTGNNPSVTQGEKDTDTRSGAVNGARSDQSNVTLDGIPVNPKGGYAFQSVLPVTLDSVEEFRVTTSNAEADAGSAGGAQVALVTKSGTNTIHGSVYEYNRNSFVSANDYFLKQSELQSGNPNQPQFLNRNIFGASVGGPIKKDRLYYFANFEAYRDAEQQSVLRIVPTAALRDGVVQYVCDTPSDCPGNTVTGASGASYSAAPGNYVLSPAQLKAMDPAGALAGYTGPVGPNPVVMKFFNTYPLPNDFSQGDGFNTAGYRFAAPTSNMKNWYIAKLDYNLTKDGKQRLSLSGSMANENQGAAPFLPGDAPTSDLVNYSKGLIANYTSTLKSTLVNSFRYGFIRESLGTIGNTDQTWSTFRGLDPTFGSTLNYSSEFQRPINTFWDDLNWTHGKHSLQFGFQASLIRNPTQSTTSSFSNGYTNAQWLNTSGLAGRTSSPLNPANNGFPAVDFNGFGTNYDNAVTALFGMDVEVNAQYNYARNGDVLAQGAPVVRHYAEDGYEMYAQDTWKVRPSLTVTAGLRYSLFSPPWETKGLEVTPTESLNTWFNSRGIGMNNGVPSIDAPPVAFNFSGPANGGTPGYYNWDWKNLGPRLALAWSPGFSSGLLGNLFGGPGKSSVRAGFGIVYDRIGESLLDTFDQNGAFGLSSSIQNAAGQESVACTPRITNLNVLPTVDNCGSPILVPAPAANYPAPFPSNPAPGSEAITWGLDNNIKTPYSYTLDLSVQRELGSGFTIQAAYVGRLAHRLLAQEDLAMPLDPYDKAAGIDYFTAATAMAKLYRNGVTTNTFNPNMVSPAVQKYWADITQPLAPGGSYSIGANSPYGSCAQGGLNSTKSPTVLAFDLLCANALNESLSIEEMDVSGVPDALNPSQSYFYRLGNYTGPNVFYSPQYTSLYGLRTVTNANYNAMEVTLQHKMTHGVQFDFNYTYSHSIDISSDAERVGAWGGLGGQIINSWDPSAGRASSDYDLRHQLNANFIFELPFGRNRLVAHDANRFVDAVIGGWQLSGLARWTSGFPVTVDNGGQYPTNYQLEGHADQIGAVQTGTYYTGPNNNGVGSTAPNLFANGILAANDFGYAYPGETGDRNNLRGPGFFGVDLGLAKRWTMPWSEHHTLQFRWEVFNVTNSVRFDVQSANALEGGSLANGNGANFGNFSGTLTNPRIMQFALRYEF
jgi:Carboxypeptidase regulatory-like domain